MIRLKQQRSNKWKGMRSDTVTSGAWLALIGLFLLQKFSTLIDSSSRQLRSATVTMDSPQRTGFHLRNIESVVINPGNSSIHPPKCTSDQLARVKQQLTPDRCVNTQNYPWFQKCSFTQATKCPDPIWLHEFHRKTSGVSFLSYFIGCNKAIDAVNALRMGSKNPKFDLVKWQEHLQTGGATFDGSSCGQFDKGQSDVAMEPINEAKVVCAEPITNTFVELDRTKKELGWGDELTLLHGAFSSKPGSLRVPSLEAMTKTGTENLGIHQLAAECSNPSSSIGGKCMDVPIMTLDDYHQQNGHGKVHYLSIDVEGFDPLVLQGGMKMLKDHVQYLEFENNWMAGWAEADLSNVIARLKDIGFTCYWPGTNGEIWRMTDCWLDHYDLKFWSNVACVNQNDAEAAPMAKRMEELFLETLKKDVVYQ